MYHDDYTLPSHQDADTSLAPTSSLESRSRISFGEELYQASNGFSFYDCCCCIRDSLEIGRGRMYREDALEEEEELALIERQQKQRRRLVRFAFVANAFFLLGSAVQAMAAFNDFQWAQSVQGFPAEVLRDDASWEAYQRSMGYGIPAGKGQRLLYSILAEDHYYNVQWIYLPYEVQRALVTLGHNEHTWNGDAKSQLDQTWKELTYDQKHAAKVLGFYSWSWDHLHLNAEGDYVTADPTTYPTYSPTDFPTKYPTWKPTETPTYSPTHNLTSHPTRKPTGTPTHSPTRNPTSHPTRHPTNHPTSSSMEGIRTTDQQSSPNHGHYDDTDASLPYHPKESWETSTPTTAKDYSLVASPEEWKDIMWYFLPADIRTAFESLGYNEDNWQARGSPATEGLYWGELTHEQRESANHLGYTKKEWDEATWTKLEEEKKKKMEEKWAESPVSSSPTAFPTGIEPNATLVPVVEAVPTMAKVTPSPTVMPKKTGPKEAPPPALAPVPPRPTPAAPIKESPKPTPTIKPTPKPTRKPSPSPTKDPLRYSDAVYNDDRVFISRSEYFDDDIVVTVGYTDIAMSQLLSVGASLCFLMFGILNWIRDEQVFHVCVVQGAASMMLSAACKDYSYGGAVIFQTLAYHCYFLEGIYLLRLRKNIQPLDGLDTLSIALWTADSLFGAGALVGVVQGYWQFLHVGAEYDLNLASGKLFSAGLWLVSSSICFLATFVLCRRRLDRRRNRHATKLSEGKADSD